MRIKPCTRHVSFPTFLLSLFFSQDAIKATSILLIMIHILSLILRNINPFLMRKTHFTPRSSLLRASLARVMIKLFTRPLP